MARKSFIIEYAKKGQDIVNMASFSGGGVKGKMQLKVLAEIEEKTEMPVSKIFQTLTGTSVGGLIAVLLAIPKEPGSTEPRFSAKEALEIFENSATDIFPQHWYHVGKIGQIFSHKYSQKPLKALLDKYLGDMELGELLGRVLITTFDVNGKDSIKIFDSHNAPGVKVKDVVLATTAAPSYFKSVKFEDENGVSRTLIDGGVGYNRPAAEALKYLKEGLSRDQQGEMLDNMNLVAFNFESPREKKEPLPPHLDGMLPQLVNGLVSDIMKAAQNAATKEVERDLPGEGQFVNLLLPVPKGATKLDNSNPKNMAKLEKATEKYIADNKELIEQLCATLVKNVNAREENSKLHEQQISVDDSSISSELAAGDKMSDNIGKKGQDKDESNAANNPVISKEFDMQQLATKLNAKQIETLQQGLDQLHDKDYALLQIVLKGLNDTQVAALSDHLPSIADGSFTDAPVPEFSNLQNLFIKSFSSLFMPDANYTHSYTQESVQEEVYCEGRGSDLSHIPEGIGVC